MKVLGVGVAVVGALIFVNAMGGGSDRETMMWIGALFGVVGVGLIAYDIQQKNNKDK